MEEAPQKNQPPFKVHFSLKYGKNDDTVSMPIEMSQKAYHYTKRVLKKDIDDIALQPSLIHFDDKNHTISIGYSYDDLMGILAEKRDGKLQLKASGALLFSFHKDATNFFNNTADNHADIPLPTPFKVIPNLKLFEKRRKEAIDYYNNFTPPEQSKISDIDTSSGTNLLKSLLKKDVVIIGEDHRDKAAKQLLIDNMALLKQENVTILLEGIFKHRQMMLDEYIFSQEKEPSQEIKEFLVKREKLKGVLEAAKKHGVKVMGVEDPITYDANSLGACLPLDYFDTSSRILLMNKNAIQIAKQVKAGGGKPLMVTGSLHITNFKNPCNNKVEMSGLAEVFGVPAIKVQDDITKKLSIDRGLTIVTTENNHQKWRSKITSFFQGNTNSRSR